MREIGNRSPGLDGGPQHALHNLARRIAHQHRPEAAASIGGDGCELADIVQCRLNLAVDKLERHAGQEDSVEEAFQDRRIAVVPDRKRQHQRFSIAQPFDVASDRIVRLALSVVAKPLRPCQPRIEILGVEIAVVDRMACRGEPLDDRLVQAGVKAGLHRVRVKHQDVHRSPRGSARRTPLCPARHLPLKGGDWQFPRLARLATPVAGEIGAAVRSPSLRRMRSGPRRGRKATCLALRTTNARSDSEGPGPVGHRGVKRRTFIAINSPLSAP